MMTSVHKSGKEKGWKTKRVVAAKTKGVTPRKIKRRGSYESANSSTTSSVNDLPWCQQNWLEQFDSEEVEAKSSVGVVRDRLTALFNKSTRRLDLLRTHFGEVTGDSSSSYDSPLESQIRLLLRSFDEMLDLKKDEDHMWTRWEYCESYLPMALRNLDVASGLLLLTPCQVAFIHFALFEVLFLNSVLSPHCLSRCPRLLAFYQNFRFWLYDQSLQK